MLLVCISLYLFFFFFFFNDTATTEIYTLSLHDALPIYALSNPRECRWRPISHSKLRTPWADRKSTRLNSSHLVISYAVFCLKKKKKKKKDIIKLSMQIDITLYKHTNDDASSNRQIDLML